MKNLAQISFPSLRLIFSDKLLEDAQAGLSWRTVVKKISHYRQLFKNFDVQLVAQMSDEELLQILANPASIRNRLKIFSTRNNAQKMLAMQAEFGSFNDYIWGFVGHQSQQNQFVHASEIPTTTPISDAISKDVKRRGFKFIGSTICYALMQASGMVNDHLLDCYRHPQCTKLSYSHTT